MVDINTELGPIPTILSDFATVLGDELRSSLERQLMGRNSPAFPSGLKEQLALPSPSPGGGRYNTSLMSAVTLFVGATSVAHAKARTGSSLFSASDFGPQLFLRLASEFDVEGLCQECSYCPLKSQH
jgi:CCR4-NOT transcription complex subunit 1